MDKEMIEQIYDGICGMLSNPSDYTIRGIEVQNEFLPNSEWDDLQSQIYDAKKSILQRLGVTEDDDYDLLKIMDCQEEITRHLCFRMFHYGVMFAIDETLQ